MALQQAGGHSEELPISVDVCHALVERLAASQELRRASRLREFLLYVCGQTLDRGATEIHEQEIGEAVFQRSPAYDTSVDNIVRVNATALRKRLEQYFSEEGAREEIILEIPRGSYRPVFRRRSAVVEEAGLSATPVALETDEPEMPGVGADRVLDTAAPAKMAAAQWVWPGVSALLLAGLLVVGWQNRRLDGQLHPWRQQAALRAFWGEFFDKDGAPDLVLADTSFALATDVMQRKATLSDYLNYNYKRFAESPALSADQRKDLSLVLERNSGSIGDFRVAQQVLALNTGTRRANLQFARDFTILAAKQDSLILIGSEESNPWVSLFVDKLNFALERDPVQRRPFVVNRNPHSGESARYPTYPAVEPPNVGYAVIAYLPDLSGKGRALIIEGTDSQATGAAGEFVTSEESLAAFTQRLPPGPVPSFEILLRTSQISGTPLHAEVIAFRTYPEKQE